MGKGDAFEAGAADDGKLTLLTNLLPAYQEVLKRLADLGVEWVQVDEPILVLDLPPRGWMLSGGLTPRLPTARSNCCWRPILMV
ncbi:cobalamin-independent synthase, N-terminal domain protein [Bordetella holmesii 35009]|nr:cobalamin-independent synthase, N-terminal domain protein [Bordetella holmesii 35009]